MDGASRPPRVTVNPETVRRLFKPKSAAQANLPPYIASKRYDGSENDRVILEFTETLERCKRERFTTIMTEKHKYYVLTAHWQADNRIRILVKKRSCSDARLDIPSIASGVFIELLLSK